MVEQQTTFVGKRFIAETFGLIKLSFCSARERRYIGATTGQNNALTQLKYEHIFLTSYSKMRVDLAAQVKNIFAILIPIWLILFT